MGRKTASLSLRSHVDFSADRMLLICACVVLGMDQVQLAIIGLTVTHYLSLYVYLCLSYHLYRLFFCMTCYILTDTRVPTVLN